MQDQISNPFETEETQAVEQQWFDPNNAIHSAVAKIEKISSEAEAAALVEQLADATGFYQFALGGVLVKIQAQGWTNGVGEFYAYLEDRFGMKKRKAQYLMSVFNTLVSLNVPWEKAKLVGWSNLRILAPLLTPENVDEWLSKASGQTHGHVKAMIALAKQDGTIPSGKFDDLESEPVVKKVFKIHADQVESIDNAIAKAKQEGNTQFDGQALEYVCMDYLAGGKKPTTTVNALFQKIKKSADTPTDAIDVILTAFCEIFPEVTIEVTIDDGSAPAPQAASE